MAIHTKQRQIEIRCATCGTLFFSGTTSKKHCSIECRIKDAARSFVDVQDCWNWSKSINPSTGYGQLSAWEDGKRKLYTAHRVSFTAFVGQIPTGMSVCHTCDNRRCFNPSHLFIGTQQDNMRDCMDKGRFSEIPKQAIPWQHKSPEKILRGEAHPMFGKKHLHGSTHPMAKLSEDHAREIKNSTEKGVDLAKRFGVTCAAISAIRNGKIWKHL